MSYYVYLLRCEGGSLYAGITTDPARRLAQHRGIKKGGAKYTAVHRPVDFAALWRVADRSAASRLEYRLKKLSRTQKDALIRGEGELPPGFESATRLPV